jgi:hypothetical protein
MKEPPTSILSRNEGQSLSDGLLEGFACASTHPSQHRLQFGERLFNGREIGRIGRQEEKAAPLGFDGLPHTGSQMNAQVIQDDDLSRAQAGGQQLLHIDLKSGRISGSIQHERFSHALQGQRSDQRHGGSIVTRNLADGSLSSGRISIQGGHGDMRARLIHKDQLLTEQLAGLLAPGRTSRFILLACSQGLFFRVQPRATLARLMLAVLTWMPWAAWNRRQCSSRVASG